MCHLSCDQGKGSKRRREGHLFQENEKEGAVIVLRKGKRGDSVWPKTCTFF